MESNYTTINEAIQDNKSVKLWCFTCEKEFNKEGAIDSEVFCPDCGGISAIIESENDPRNFEVYESRRENNTVNPSSNLSQINTSNDNRPPATNNNSNQQNQFNNTDPLLSLVTQVIGGPLGTMVFQGINGNLTNVNNNSNQNQGATNQAQPMQFITNIFSNFVQGAPMQFSPFNMGMNVQGNIFGDLESRIIEEFLRNDPNRHGPPPASQQSIDRLRKVVFNSETCKFKDCSVCQEDYKDKDIVNIMACGHAFHKQCLSEWLARHNSCPVCRKPLVEEREYDGVA